MIPAPIRAIPAPDGAAAPLPAAARNGAPRNGAPRNGAPRNGMPRLRLIPATLCAGVATR